jgi:hypothetical protein
MGSEHQLFDSNLTKKRTSEETDIKVVMMMMTQVMVMKKL